MAMPPTNAEFLGVFLPIQPSLRAYLHAAVGSRAAVEELQQDVAVALWEKFSTYDQERPFLPWALGMARIQVLRWRQTQFRDRRLLSAETAELLAESAAEPANELTHRLDFIAGCLGQVGERITGLLRRHHVLGESARTIAEADDTTTTAVENALMRARKALRHCVERRSQTVAP